MIKDILTILIGIEFLVFVAMIVNYLGVI